LGSNARIYGSYSAVQSTPHHDITTPPTKEKSVANTQNIKHQKETYIPNPVGCPSQNTINSFLVLCPLLFT